MVKNGLLEAGLIGANIQKTRLPAALKIMCEDAGLRFEFQLIDTANLDAFDFATEVEKRIDLEWTGVTVTHPHKLDATQFTKSVKGGKMAKKVAHLNASNTLVFDSGITGYNTDYSGFLAVWKQCMGSDLPGKVCLAGAGGVAAAIGPALKKLGAEKITIWDLEIDKAHRLAEQIGSIAEVVSIENSEREIITADGLVNATALGMVQYPGSAFNSEFIGSQKWAFDSVYTPTNTAFLQSAKRAGLNGISGFELFCHMAVRTFETYTGIRPELEATLAKLRVLKPD